MPRFPRRQWDSAHHGPVFPGCQMIKVVWVIGILASRDAFAPARHHTWLYLLGRDHAPGGRRLEVNGDGQVLTLSFSRRLIICRGPTGSRPLWNEADSNRTLHQLVKGAHSVIWAVPCCRSFPAASGSLQVPRLSGVPEVCRSPSGVYSAPVDIGFLRQPRLKGCFGRLPISHHQAGKKRKRGNLELCGSRERSVAGAPHLNEAARGQKPLPAAAEIRYCRLRSWALRCSMHKISCKICRENAGCWRPLIP